MVVCIAMEQEGWMNDAAMYLYKEASDPARAFTLIRLNEAPCWAEL